MGVDSDYIVLLDCTVDLTLSLDTHTNVCRPLIVNKYVQV